MNKLVLLSFVVAIQTTYVTSKVNEFDKKCMVELAKKEILKNPSPLFETCVITTFEVLNGDDKDFPQVVKIGAQEFFDELKRLKAEAKTGLDLPETPIEKAAEAEAEAEIEAGEINE